MVGCRCGVDVENVVTMTALSRRIGEVEGESWCRAGSVIIIMTLRQLQCSLVITIAYDHLIPA